MTVEMLRERRQHDHAPEQLVEVEQAVADERLRQEKQIDGDEDVPHRGRPGNQVQERRGHGGQAAHQQIEQADLSTRDGVRR